MPEYVIHRLVDAMNDDGKALRGSRVLVIGAAYKKDISDVRESPAVEVIELLQKAGALVEYHDPHVPRIPKMRRHQLALESVPLSEDRLGATDAVVVVTNHDVVDWELIGRCARLVVDTRNVYGKGRSAVARIVPA